MTQNAAIILTIACFFIYQFYKHRKAIWYNMNLYGEYFANVMKQKEDEIRKRKETKNERR